MLVENFANEYLDSLLKTLCDLAVIPAPSGQEDLRANFCLDFLKNNGLSNAYIDDAKNVIFTVGDLSKPAVLFLAHTDTVFAKDLPLNITESDGKLFCPAIGDNTVSVAVLLYLALFAYKNQHLFDRPFIFSFNSCEEGAGNLKGAKKIYSDYGKVISEVLVLDGYLETLNDTQVGSRRYKISVETKGGHSFRDFGNQNAILAVSKIINELDKIAIPTDGITTYNFGTITGGTTVNTIPAHAEFLYEFRSNKSQNLSYMDGEFFKVLNGFTVYDKTVTLIGERPCAIGVDSAKQESLKNRVWSVLEDYVTVKTYPASTDCNVFSSQGIPAVCFGVSTGDGAHTTGEYIVKDSIKTGFLVALKILFGYF